MAGEWGLVGAERVCCGIDGIEKALVVAKNIGLCDAEFKVKNVKIFAFNATDVAFAKDTGTQGPVDVL